LYGGGTMTLGGNGARVITSPGASLLTNEDNTIRGGGEIGAGAMGLLNRGSIVADGNVPLVLLPNSRGLTNEGVFRAEPNALLSAPGPAGSFTNFAKSTATLNGGTYDVAGTLRFTDAYVLHNNA